MDFQPLQPNYGRGQVLTATGTSQTATVLAGRNLCISNKGVNWGSIRIGATAVAASETTDYPVPPGMQVVVTKGFDDTALTYISAGGTTFHVMGGQGA